LPALDHVDDLRQRPQEYFALQTEAHADPLFTGPVLTGPGWPERSGTPLCEPARAERGQALERWINLKRGGAWCRENLVRSNLTLCFTNRCNRQNRVYKHLPADG